VMLDLVKKWVPHCYEAFMKNQKTGKTLSGPALEIVRQMLQGKKISQEESGLSVREWGELMNLLEIKK